MVMIAQSKKMPSPLPEGEGLFIAAYKNTIIFNLLLICFFVYSYHKIRNNLGRKTMETMMILTKVIGSLYTIVVVLAMIVML